MRYKEWSRPRRDSFKGAVIVTVAAIIAVRCTAHFALAPIGDDWLLGRVFGLFISVFLILMTLEAWGDFAGWVHEDRKNSADSGRRW